MSFLEEVRTKRKKLVEVLSDPEYSGIREIVEELYPDRAHFLYELLQNAEDAGAKQARFLLRDDSVAFEHDGRPFNEDDISAITNIGKGSKKDQIDKIGRFGIGFKAVFAYTDTPHIWSPTFSFKIRDLVLPEAIPAKPSLGTTTRFEFPFNNPKKSARTAHAEVAAGLNELVETTLLFLNHLKAIFWQINQQPQSSVLRLEHSKHHIEVLKQAGATTRATSHFLRFSAPVKGLDGLRVSIAYALDRLPRIDKFDVQEPLAKQLKIVPANPGRVAVFFPAEKEASGLRFHLHAPFVPELSRASIKETTANEPLFEQLATLSADSLSAICQYHLLTAEFLSVLPNNQEDVPERYQPIRAAIIDAMNNQPLTPTHCKSHAPAKCLLQAKASLKELLSEQDLSFVLGRRQKWAIGISQKNSNQDRFLCGLDISDWDIDAFANLLQTKTRDNYRSRPDAAFMKWLADKPIDWHQHLYAMLFRESSTRFDFYRFVDLRIIRLSDGNYSVGNQCFFPSDDIKHDAVLPRVDAGIYASGKSKSQQDDAKKFLEKIGVRDVGEAEQIEAILRQRYTQGVEIPGEDTYRRDLKRFVAFVEHDSDAAEVFADYFIFETDDGWQMPDGVFLDSPFMYTGLSAYYQVLGKNAPRLPLAEQYRDRGISVERLVKFAEAVGVHTTLPIDEITCYENPEWRHLSSVGGERDTSPINRDYTIVGLKQLLANPSLATSRLIWQTMCSLPRVPEYLQAIFQRNYSHGSRCAASQLVHHLREAAWVPQGDGSFVRPAGASRELLPEGFPSDPGWAWLHAINFGQEAAKSIEERGQKDRIVKQLGFADNESLKRAQRFAKIPPEEQERFLAEHERGVSDLVDRESANVARRVQRVSAQAAGAPERRSEERTRSVAVELQKVKQEAAQYLRQQYTNRDGEMICQICKTRLPFKLDDNRYYFESVELLPDLHKRHYQGYLALCPNHAAMFMYANASRDTLKKLIANLEGTELEVVLARKGKTVRFTRLHIADLKVVIKNDGQLSVRRTEAD